MRTELYSNFIAVADMRSINAAAKQLLIAQPALSAQIHAIEQEYGAQLFTRLPRSVELTDAGHIFYRHAKNIVQLERNIRLDLEAVKRGDAGTLKLGTTRSTPDPMLQRLLERFSEAYPSVQVILSEYSSAELIEDVEHNVSDIAFIRVNRDLPPSINTVMTFPEHFRLFCAPELGFLPPEEDTVPLEMLADVPMSLPKGSFQYISDIFQRYDVRLNVQSLNTSRSQVLDWAIMKRAVALISIPETIGLTEDRFTPPGLQSWRIKGNPMRTRRLVITKKGQKLPASAQRFLEIIYELYAPV